MDTTRADLVQGLESLNKIFLQNGLGAGRVDLRRTLTAVAPQQTSLYDSVLERVPNAVEKFSSGSVEEAQQLFKDVAALEAKERKAANWGGGIQSHHPNELVAQYVAFGDKPMYQALHAYDTGRQAGLNLGTQREAQLALTQPGHVAAHTNLRTQANGSFGSNENTSALLRQSDLYERIDNWIPKAMEEAAYSRLAFDLPQERSVRRKAASLLGITEDQLISTERDPNQRKNGQRTLANTNRDKLPQSIMDGIIQQTYKGLAPEIVIPKLELITPGQGKNKGVTRAVPVKDPASNELDRLIQGVRPGEVEILRRLGFKY